MELLYLIAMNASSDSVKSRELGYEKKQWDFSFNIQGNDNQFHEFLNNTNSGKSVEKKLITLEPKLKK
jgi:hypothetical protein